MKKGIAVLLCLLMMLSVVACAGTKPAAPSADATAAEQAKTWIEAQIKNDTLFSFTYNGAEYKKHIKDWTKTVDETDDGWKLTYLSKDGVEFTVTVKYDETHAALDWVGSFHHTGSQNSGVIGKVMMLDSEFAIADAVMTTANQGGTVEIDDFQAYETDLKELGAYQVKNTGGRSAQGAWPWFDVTSGDNTYGIMGAIGWSGTWQADFTYQKGITKITCGMQNTNYYMEPNETLRTPSIVIQFFKGTQNEGHNDWRQLILANYNPKTPSGEPVTYAPITINTWGGQGSHALVEIMQSVVTSGQYFEYQWIDAGWYGDVINTTVQTPDWKQQLGNWYYNPGYDGVGFSEISNLAKENNYGVLVWFEPSRAWKTSKLYQEHPDYFFPSTTAATGTQVVDYGNPEALEYIINMVMGFLDDMQIDFYRQDYNDDPAEPWTRKDLKLDPDGNRTGVSEIKFITGLYTLLDTIIASGRQIDNCASGGRLIDIEMTKRSIPLWRTDYTVAGNSSTEWLATASGVYSQGAGLAWWTVHSGGQVSEEKANTEYGFRAFMASGATMSLFSDQYFAKRMIDELLYNREYMLHDFYILTQGYGDETDSKNAGYEYYIPEQGRGYLVCFRPTNSGTEYTTFRLEGLEPDATYVLKNADTDETHELTGEILMTYGLEVFFPKAQTAHMIYFDKK